jgi:hypothetical protein
MYIYQTVQTSALLVLFSSPASASPVRQLLSVENLWAGLLMVEKQLPADLQGVEMWFLGSLDHLRCQWPDFAYSAACKEKIFRK